MIPKYVIRQFLNRELNDYRPYAKMSRGALLSERKSCRSDPRFGTIRTPRLQRPRASHGVIV